jgi:hypothetical protein
MRLESVRIVVGSCVVYAIVAACSAGGSHSPGKKGGPMAAAGGRSGGIGGSGGAPPDVAGGVPADGTGGLGTDHPAGNGGAAGTDPVADAAGQGGGGILDPVPDAKADPKSGTRLKARMLVGEDGSRQWNYGWYDSQRGENCQFMLATDGVTRCLPFGGAPAAAASGPFGDTGCSQPLVTATKPSACNGNTAKAPKSAYKLGPLCGGTYTYEMYNVGAAYEGSMVYTGSPAACVGSAVTPTVAYYYQGTLEPAASFVGATEEVEP